MASLRNQIGNYILMYVAIPLAILLLLLNFQYWNILTAHNEDRINHLVEDAVQAVNNEIKNQLNIIDDLAASSEVVDLLSPADGRPDALPTGKEWNLEKWFDEIVKLEQGGTKKQTAIPSEVERQIQFNPLSEKLILLAKSHPALGRIQVTDILGDFKAANVKLLSFNAGNESWWRNALLSGHAFQFEGLDDEGQFWATKALFKPGQDAPIGVIRAEIVLKGLVAELDHPLPYENSGIAVRGQGEEFYFTHGNPEINEAHADKTVRHVIVRYNEQGWHDGVRFKQLLVAKEFKMANSPRVLAFIKEPLTPADQLTRVGLSSLVSVLFLLLVIFLARRSGKRLGEGTAEILAAGNLLLHRMQNQAGGPPIPHSIKSSTFKNVDDRFSLWLKGFRQSVLDNIETHQYEEERDQELARDFQLAYLNRPYPAVPARTSPGRLKLTFHHRYQPALALGGDFFEISRLAPDVAGIFISDVMGHGTRSALITSSLRSLLNDNLGQGRNARLFMSEVNKGFCDLLTGIRLQHPMFASAYFFVADVTARAATFCTAGHPAPIQISRASNHVSRLVVAEPHGAALGIDPQEEYTGGSCRLAAGDVFIFYTDGVYEAFNAYGQEFGMDQLEKTLRGLMHNTLQEMVDGLLAAVIDFTGNEPLQDDICILGVEVTEG